MGGYFSTFWRSKARLRPTLDQFQYDIASDGTSRIVVSKEDSVYISTSVVSSTGDGIIDTAVYKSDGLSKLGTNSCEVTFMTKHAEGQATIPTDPIMLIGLVYWIVKGGTTLSHGVLLSLAEKLGDFMGKTGLNKCIVLRMNGKMQQILCPQKPTLILYPIYDSEAELERIGGGLSRLVNMLARRAASFPFDPIFDQEREALVIGIPEATSVLSDTVQVFLENSTATHDVPSNRVTLTIPAKSASAFSAIFKELPIETAFVVLSDIDEFATSSYVWVPELKDPNRPCTLHAPRALEPAESISVCFVGFLTDQKSDDCVIFEDGCFARITEASWQSIRAKLQSGESLSLENTEGLSLRIQFQ